MINSWYQKGEEFFKSFQNMRNLTWLFIFQLILLSNLQSQPLIIDWQQCYAPRDVNVGISISKRNNGYALLCHITNSGGAYADWWLIRTDTLGDTLWSKTYGGSNQDEPSQMKQTPDGGLILAGTTFSTNGNVQGNHGGADYWVVKVDSLGNIQWQKCFGGTGDDFLSGIDITSDSGFICMGRTNSNDGDVTGNHGFWDIWVIRLDKNGNIKWEKCYGGSAGDYPPIFSGLTVTSDGGAIVCGATNSNDGDVHFNPHGGEGIVEAWIIKLDSAGEIQWEKCYGGTSYDNMNIALPSGDGGYICVGSTSSNDCQVSGNHGAEDVWVIKIDNLGNLLWQKCYGGSQDDDPYCMKASSDGNFFVGGYTYSHDGDVSGNHSVSDGTDMWLIKISPQGELLWQQCIGGDGDEAIFDFLDLSPQKLLLLGDTHFSNNTGDMQCNPNPWGKHSVWLVSMTDTTYTGVNESENKDRRITVFPVPANQFVRFDLTNHMPATDNMIIIMDGIGRIVQRVKVNKTEKYVTWNTMNYMPGLYYYQLTGGNSIETGKIIIMK